VFKPQYCKKQKQKNPTQTTINLGDDVGEKEPSYTAGGNVN
jgi:hypothetical protein